MKIFFDLDGTLLDVSDRNYRVYCEVTEAFGGTPMPKPQYWELKRKKTKWPELLPLSALSPDIEQQFLDKFIQKIEDPNYLKIDKLMPQALEVVSALAANNQCYLVSLRRRAENLRQQLEWLALAPHFTKILSGHSESDGYDKKIELIKAELAGEPGVIIGDTEADIVTGKQLGLLTIAVTSGIRDQQFLAALQPDHIVAAIDEVPTLILAS